LKEESVQNVRKGIDHSQNIKESKIAAKAEETGAKTGDAGRKGGVGCPKKKIRREKATHLKGNQNSARRARNGRKGRGN